MYDLLVAHLDTTCDMHLGWLGASLVVGTCCGLSLSQQCLQDLLQMQRALSCLFCHLSWSAVAERWCLSRMSVQISAELLLCKAYETAELRGGELRP